VNGKTDVGLVLRIIQARLDARPVSECGVCGRPAVEAIWPLNPNVPPRGVCAQHLTAWLEGRIDC
jgi:hypothetical protein